MSGTEPLKGVRVADFCWIGAGSFTTKILADAGADVIKIESSQRLDTLRVAPPYKDGIKGVNRSGYFADRNTSKRSLTIDLKHEGAREIIYGILAECDIVANNFTPGVMDRLGFSYEDVRRINPEIIYLAMSMQGKDGPESGYLGYGLTIGALTGLHHLCGLPDRTPAGTGTNYPDHLPNPCHAAFALLAALRHKRRTGKGQYIDIAQTEPTISLLAPAVLDYTVNGHVATRDGNDHCSAAPHGVYPCAGQDRWIAISVCSESQWQGLCRVLGGLDEGAGWTTAAGRHAGRHEIDALLMERTVGWDAEELMISLQSEGVAAGVVRNAGDLITRDAQLRHRQHWVTLDHPEIGPSIYNGPPYRFSRSKVQLRSPAPLLGEHTDDVLEQLLGLSAEEIEAKRNEGLLV